jgi:hypothetical protein
MLISDTMVHAAFDYLNDAADAAAKARANRILAEYGRKRKLAELILEAPHKTGELRRAWAEAHNDYWLSCEEEAEAIKADEWHRHQRVRAEAVCEAWRTEQANLRGTGRVG